MQNIRPFQIALLGIFALMAVVSLALIAGFEGFVATEEKVYGDSVVIWGPFDFQTVDQIFNEIARTDKQFNVVTYEQKDLSTFETELVDAIAEGRGPDVVMISHDLLVSLRAKLLPIPYDTYPERTFKDRFVDGAEIFARIDGVYAIPFAVDPLVMYWNRDLFSAAGFAQPPATWDVLVSQIVPALTRRDSSRAIMQSALAFGEYANVTKAKEVLLTLAMQSGSTLILEDDRGYTVALDTPLVSGNRPPLNAAVQFFTDFSNANSQLYSWNRAMQNDRTAFLAGDLALYFGYGSEGVRIEASNPNLNFDAALVPQGAGATVKRVYGDFYGLAIVRTSDNISGSYAAIQTFSQDAFVGPFVSSLALAPASRTLLAAGNSDAIQQVVFASALIARAWLDPSPVSSDNIFAQMIDDIVSSRQKVANAVSDAVRRLELAF